MYSKLHADCHRSQQWALFVWASTNLKLYYHTMPQIIISEKPTQKSKKVTIRRLPRFALVKRSFAVTALIMSAASQQHSVGSDGELYRHDGVRITHDPFSDGMVSCFQSRYTRGRRWKDFNKRQLFCLYTRILLSRTLQCAGEDASTSAHCTVFIVD